jgi:hypothetical protein
MFNQNSFKPFNQQQPVSNYQTPSYSQPNSFVQNTNNWQQQNQNPVQTEVYSSVKELEK